MCIRDSSDSGTDPDGPNAGEPNDTGGSDDPTPLFLPSVGLAKSVGTPVPNGDNFDVTYTLVFENTGNVSLDNVQVLDDVAAQFGSQFVGIVPGSVAVQNFNGTGTAPTANAGFESSTAMSLVTSAGAVDPGDTFEVVYTVTIDPSQAPAGSIGLDNQASTSGEPSILTATQFSTPQAILSPPMTLVTAEPIQQTVAEQGPTRTRLQLFCPISVLLKKSLAPPSHCPMATSKSPISWS